VALGALAFDVAVGQEHVLLRVEELLNGFGFDKRATLRVRDVAQVAVNLAGQFVVLRRIGAVPVVKADVKAVQVLLAASGNIGHELLRRFASLLRRNHDGRAVGVVCPHKIDRVALHPLVPHPNVGLDVLHDVADMEVAVGVGQGGGNEELAGHGEWAFWTQPVILVFGLLCSSRSQPNVVEHLAGAALLARSGAQGALRRSCPPPCGLLLYLTVQSNLCA
jgi:hypothetical protein